MYACLGASSSDLLDELDLLPDLCSGIGEVRHREGHLFRCRTYVVGKPPSPPLALQSPAFNTFFLVPHIGRVILPHFIFPNPGRKGDVCTCNGSAREVFPDPNASTCDNDR